MKLAGLIPSASFMRQMGGASLFAGVLMLIMAPFMPRIQRIVNRA